MTNDISSTVNGPVGNVLVSFLRSTELIVAHPDVKPNESVSKLP